MEWLENINAAVNNVVWGPIMLVLLIGTGIYLSIRCGFLQARKFGYIWKNTFATLFHKEKSEAHKSDGTNVTPFQAVSTALALHTSSTSTTAATASSNTQRFGLAA